MSTSKVLLVAYSNSTSLISNLLTTTNEIVKYNTFKSLHIVANDVITPLISLSNPNTSIIYSSSNLNKLSDFILSNYFNYSLLIFITDTDFDIYKAIPDKKSIIIKIMPLSISSLPSSIYPDTTFLPHFHFLHLTNDKAMYYLYSHQLSTFIPTTQYLLKIINDISSLNFAYTDKLFDRNSIITHVANTVSNIDNMSYIYIKNKANKTYYVYHNKQIYTIKYDRQTNTLTIPRRLPQIPILPILLLYRSDYSVCYFTKTNMLPYKPDITFYPIAFKETDIKGLIRDYYFYLKSIKSTIVISDMYNTLISLHLGIEDFLTIYHSLPKSFIRIDKPKHPDYVYNIAQQEDILIIPSIGESPINKSNKILISPILLNMPVHYSLIEDYINDVLISSSLPNTYLYFPKMIDLKDYNINHSFSNLPYRNSTPATYAPISLYSSPINTRLSNNIKVIALSQQQDKTLLSKYFNTYILNPSY